MDTTQDPATNSRSTIPDFNSQRKSLRDSLMRDINNSRESVYREYSANNNSQHFNDQREQLRGRRRVERENKPKRKRDSSDPGIRRSINQVVLNGGLFDGAQERTKFFITITKAEESEENFADLNFKTRLDSIRNVIKSGNVIKSARRFQMKKFKKRTDTTYQVEVCLETDEDMQKLLAVTKLADCEVKIKENIGKNTIKGVIIDHDLDLGDMDNKALLNAITTPGVKDIERYGKSKVISISFGGQTKPERVGFWNELSLKVKDPIPPPDRCFKCQVYGHMSRSCRNDYACYKCAHKYVDKAEHTPKDCKAQLRCVNCDGAHMAGNKTCPIHQVEMKLARICSEQKISREEAKRKYPNGVMPKFSGAVRRQRQTPSVESQEQVQREDNTREEATMEWRRQQEAAMKDMQEQMRAQQESFKKLQLRVTTQDNLIKTLRESVDQKDKEIAELKNENELLIVKNDRLQVSSNKTMNDEINSLKEKLKKSADQIKQLGNTNADLQKQLRGQYKLPPEGAGNLPNSSGNPKSLANPNKNITTTRRR